MPGAVTGGYSGVSGARATRSRQRGHQAAPGHALAVDARASDNGSRSAATSDSRPSSHRCPGSSCRADATTRPVPAAACGPGASDGASARPAWPGGHVRGRGPAGHCRPPEVQCGETLHGDGAAPLRSERRRVGVGGGGLRRRRRHHPATVPDVTLGELLGGDGVARPCQAHPLGGVWITARHVGQQPPCHDQDVEVTEDTEGVGQNGGARDRKSVPAPCSAATRGDRAR